MSVLPGSVGRVVDEHLQARLCNCSASTDESAPEGVCFFTVDRSGASTATVSDDTVDVDVHSLDADDARSCLDRDDATATASVGPRRCFVVVDTCAADGSLLPGPFTPTISIQERGAIPAGSHRRPGSGAAGPAAEEGPASP